MIIYKIKIIRKVKWSFAKLSLRDVTPFWRFIVQLLKAWAGRQRTIEWQLRLRLCLRVCCWLARPFVLKQCRVLHYLSQYSRLCISFLGYSSVRFRKICYSGNTGEGRYSIQCTHSLSHVPQRKQCRNIQDSLTDEGKQEFAFSWNVFWSVRAHYDSQAW